MNQRTSRFINVPRNDITDQSRDDVFFLPTATRKIKARRPKRKVCLLPRVSTFSSVSIYHVLFILSEQTVTMPKCVRMPRGSPQYLNNLPNNLRVEPYPLYMGPKGARSKPSNADKENADVIAKPKPRTKKTSVKGSSKVDSENLEPEARAPKPKKVPEAQQHYSDWREIELEEVYDEVCCFDNASTVRRKLKKLLSDKDLIPCGDGKKRWTQASMSAEMQALEYRHGTVEYKRNMRGPTVAGLSGFLKKTGNMGGGDSAAYYWGYVLCEKLRIWEVSVFGGAPTTHLKMSIELRDMSRNSNCPWRRKC